MRSGIVRLLIGLGLTVATAVPSFACAYHDQQASTDAQQHTAQAQQQSPTSTQ
jgi:hypothetical protein